MQPLFEKHRATLDGALDAMRTRGFWSAYPEQPSPKIYGGAANDEGKAAARAMRTEFELDQPGRIGGLQANTRRTAFRSKSSIPCASRRP